MSEETPTPREGEEVPVPDKGGWIDGETGPVYPAPPPDVGTPVAAPERARQPAPEPEPKKKAS